MAEYIKREDAIKLIFEQFHMYFEVPCLPRDEAIQRQVCEVRDKINQLPAADVAPVRHGRWEPYTYDLCKCSSCTYPVQNAWGQTKYCPNCGAKMDSEEC